MEGIAAAASVAGLLTLAVKCGVYLDKVRNATETVEKLRQEVGSLRTVLQNLQHLLESPNASKIYPALGSTANDCEQCKRDLLMLLHALKADEQRFGWIWVFLFPFRESKNKEILQSLHRYVTIFNFSGTIDELAISSALLERHNNDQREIVLNWLTEVDPTVNHGDARKQRIPGTAQWIYETTEFKNWIAEPGSLFTLYGPYGYGKTITCASCIDHLQLQSKSDDKSTLLYFYFDATNRQISGGRTVTTMIKWFIKQLCPPKSRLNDDVETLYGQRYHALNDSDYVEVLRKMIPAYSTVYVAIDGADECVEQPALMNMIQDMRTWASGQVRVLITSRQIVDVKDRSYRPGSFYLELRQDRLIVDIDRCVAQKMKDSTNPLVSDRKDEIIKAVHTSISTSADGMFRWVMLYVESLERCLDLNSLNNQLHHPPPTLNAMYEQILSNIDKRNQVLVKRLLQWLCFTASPLSTREFEETFSVLVDPNSQRFTKDEVPIRPVLNQCHGLLKIVAPPGRRSMASEAGHLHDPSSASHEEEEIVQFAHSSVRSFLESEAALDFSMAGPEAMSSAYTMMAQNCVAYLLKHFSEENPPLNTVRAREFSWHAAYYWVTYARAVHMDHDEFLFSMCRDLLNPHGNVYYNWLHLLNCQEHWEGARKYSKDSKNSLHPICLMAGSGMKSLVKRYLEQGVSANLVGENGDSLLCLAAKNGQLDTVTTLLEKGASVKGRVNDSGTLYDVWNTPIIAAAIGGHAPTLQHLINEARVDLNNEEGRTHLGRALKRATWLGNENCVRTLLDNGASVRLKRTECFIFDVLRTGQLNLLELYLEKRPVLLNDVENWKEILEAAVRCSSTDAVLMLLKAQLKTRPVNLVIYESIAEAISIAASVDAKSYAASTSLAMVRLLYDNIEVDKSYYQNILTTGFTSATESRNLEVAFFLFCMGATHRMTEKKLVESLSLVAYEGNLHLFREIVWKHNIKTCDVRFLTAAAASCNPEMTTFLINKCRDYTRGDFSLALRAAAGSAGGSKQREQGRKNIVHLLYKQGADVNGLQCQEELADEEHRVDPLSNKLFDDRQTKYEKPWQPWDPITIAAGANNLNLVKVLMDLGAVINTPTHFRYTLQSAINRDRYDLVSSLILKIPGRTTCLPYAAALPRWRMVALICEFDWNIDECDDEGRTALHWAAEYDNWDMVQMLSNRNASPDIADMEGKSPLHIAASSKDARILGLLVKKTTKPNAKDLGGRTALHTAVRYSNLAAARLLINSGWDRTSKTNENETPLLVAMSNRNAEFVDDLLKENLVCCLTDSSDRSNCLERAIEKGFTSVFLQIINCHRDSLSQASEPTGKTPLHIAAGADHDALMPRLLNLGANPLATDKEGQTPLHIATQACSWDDDQTPEFDIPVASSWARRLIHYEKMKELFKVVQGLGEFKIGLLLICEPSAVNKASLIGVTPLMMLAKKCDQLDSLGEDLEVQQWHRNGEDRVLNMFKLAGAFPNLTDGSGKTALHHAAITGSAHLAQRILEYPGFTEVDAKDKDGHTALHFACEKGHHDVMRILVECTDHHEMNYGGLRWMEAAVDRLDIQEMRLLLGRGISSSPDMLIKIIQGGNKSAVLQCLVAAIENGSDPKRIFRSNRTLLHLAALRNQVAVATYLVSKPYALDGNAMDRRLRTPLHLAALAAGREMVRCLILHTDDIDGRDINGQAALHYAAKRGHAGIVRILIDNGADPEVRDRNGLTAYDLAVQRRRTAASKALSENKVAAPKGTLPRIRRHSRH